MAGWGKQMKKYSFIIDVAKCENCNNCFLSCKDEHCGNDWPGYSLSQPLHGQRWINIKRKERGNFPEIDVAYLPQPCMHCDDAPCVKAAKDGAVYKRDDGIVIIDPQKAKGQKELVRSCPFGAIWWNEDARVPQKCTFCAHLLDKGWEKPRCVQSCPTGALTITFVEDDTLKEIVTGDKLEHLGTPENLASPRCFYKNLYRFNSCFITGSVAYRDRTVIECAEGINIKLLRDGIYAAEQKTDDFGDFKFDKLSSEDGMYSIIVDSGEAGERKIDIKLKESVSVGILYV
jgi:Fe-S-cluster-containing dehydrogenase component